ncbi:hypothetical protein GGI12_004918 [Dipsacomyces acuminosporus]|nr:hypothetical protein GGI12_004918 [Dipsacomyces acuminosporus]
MPLAAVRLSTINPGYSLLASVAPPLPILHVVESSIGYEQVLSLIEGESQVVSFTLVNSSAGTAATNFEVSFEPSIQAGARASDDARADPKSSDLANAALRYQRLDESAEIGPQESCSLQVKALGIPGFSGCEVVLRYGGKGVDGWARELRWPLRVSVSRLFLHAEDIADDLAAKYIDLPPYIARSLNSTRAVAKSVENLSSVLADAMSAYAKTGEKTAANSKLSPQDLFCLAEVNVQSVGKTDIDLDIEVDLSLAADQSAEELSSGARRPGALVKSLSAKVPGHGSLSHLVIPLPRVRLSEQVLTAPVPGVDADGSYDQSVFYSWSRMLSDDTEPAADPWKQGRRKNERDRQFVVPRASGIRGQDAAKRREIHWHLQEIYSRVRIRWKSSQSKRFGYVDPRPLFDLDEAGLATVQHSGLHTYIRVDGSPTKYVDKFHSEAKCPAEGATSVEFVLSNAFSKSLDVDISVHAVRSDGADAGSAEYPVKHASDALLHSGSRLNDIARAEVATAFAATLPNNAAEKRRFRLRPSLVVASSPSAMQSQQGQQAPISPSGISLFSQHSRAALAVSDGFIFDSVRRLKLSPIAPGATYSLKLPLYVLRPGRYQLEYEVVERPQPGQQAAGRILKREALIIASNERRL